MIPSLLSPSDCGYSLSFLTHRDCGRSAEERSGEHIPEGYRGALRLPATGRGGAEQRPLQDALGRAKLKAVRARPGQRRDALDAGIAESGLVLEKLDYEAAMVEKAAALPLILPPSEIDLEADAGAGNSCSAESAHGDSRPRSMAGLGSYCSAAPGGRGGRFRRRQRLPAEAHGCSAATVGGGYDGGSRGRRRWPSYRPGTASGGAGAGWRGRGPWLSGWWHKG